MVTCCSAPQKKPSSLLRFIIYMWNRRRINAIRILHVESSAFALGVISFGNLEIKVVLVNIYKVNSRSLLLFGNVKFNNCSVDV
jgi:hypothetical protein